ncbi:hypothetical protein JBE04_20460 [Streptomyces sp. PRKS01-29]|nr:hypothetical protein [Streptomyces sabulosicollis]
MLGRVVYRCPGAIPVLLPPEREAEIREYAAAGKPGHHAICEVLAELDHIRGRAEAADEDFRRVVEAEARLGRLRRLFVDLEIRAGKAERERDEMTRLLGERDAEVERLRGRAEAAGEYYRRATEAEKRVAELEAHPSRTEVLRQAADELAEDEFLLAAEELREMADDAERGESQ